jgi:hypothetical protein
MAGRLLRTSRAAAVLLALVVTAACGGGPSKPEFLQEANAVCAEHRETIEAAASQVLAGGQLPTPEQFGRLAMETIIPELTAQLEELRELDAPEDVAEDVEAYLENADEAVDGIKQDPSLITDAASFQSVNQQAAGIGLSDACNIGPE